MFERTTTPRVFALPPGVDFPRALVRGLRDRMQGQPPEAMARVDLYVNTRRMARRVEQLFDEGPATLLPRIRLLTDLSNDLTLPDVPLAVSGLRRQLELSRLIEQLLESAPDLAPRAALFDLSESLATLFDEIEGEGVDPGKIAGLDVTDKSGHWERSLRFIDIVADFLATTPELGAEARQRRVVEQLVERWSIAPPQHPVLVAGSTGSRGTTALLMEAVATLPQGGLVLPGFDMDMAGAWDDLADPMTSEDHPQYRFAALMRGLGITPAQVQLWGDDAPPAAARNRLVSLALRPAPVTDSWLSEGPRLGDLGPAVSNMTLLEAASPRDEANAIALRLRAAAEDGQVAALITPDRSLTRQVAAALDRWAIIPDDSAGRPLALTAPGRFLRHVAAFLSGRPTAEDVLTLLKHPLCNTGGEDRGPHLRWTRELELSMRRMGWVYPDTDDLNAWAHDASDERRAWATWVAGFLAPVNTDRLPLGQIADQHFRTAEALCAGPGAEGSGELWKEAAGREARKAMEDILREAPFGGSVSFRDYFTLISKYLSAKEVRTPDQVHPNIMIWGTLEARVQGADLIILGGLNDGIWPSTPTPDPWLNRALRLEAGLLLPERRIGLSAHDFQQALGAKEVWLSRSVRDDEAETVPSRWVNRLLNLMEGLRDGGGIEAVADMRKRGRHWLSMAAQLDTPATLVEPAHRPSPSPPAAARPRSLSVTQVKTLIRDPYAIYAQRILRLRKLDPVRQTPDAPLRGTVLHRVLEQFISEASDADLSRDRLRIIAEAVLKDHAPWPATQRLWLAKIMRVADWFLAGEADRRTRAQPIAFETRGTAQIPELGFSLIAKADRMDRTPTGEICIYDYKTGKPPSAAEQGAFDKQLLLEVAMVEDGAFAEIGAAPVSEAAYIGIGSAPALIRAPLEDHPPARVWLEFRKLIETYLSDGSGFTARRAVAKERFGGDFDQLARFGEWDTSEHPKKEHLT